MPLSAMNEPLTLKVPAPASGGTVRWRERRATAVVMPAAAVAADGSLDDRSVMLIAADFEVRPGMVAVTTDGVNREITAVRTCRALDGKTVVYRCTFE